ncbi:MAG TPA: hypothetical protein VL400_13165 [Polyangiaceae bacterium]|jgi:hypothetical protein|nr:hypothetical protein [Polyangiaceae bacterium]
MTAIGTTRSRSRSGRQALAGVVLFAALPFAPCCVSVGEGTGAVRSDHLIAKGCWDDAYDLQPDFFAADPSEGSMDIRVQRGSDLIEVSDGVVVLVDDVEYVRAHLGEALPVTLPEGVAPPGIPVGALCGDTPCSDAKVHLTLYLLESCHTQNLVFYATSGTMTFDELFSGDPNEKDAAEKLTVARFDVMVGDPRDATKGADGTYTIPNESQIKGYFRFFFQRGQPAQPFP